MFAAFGIVLVLQICIRILWSYGAANTRRLFAMFPVPFVFLAFALLKGLRRSCRHRCAGFSLESLALVLTFALFERPGRTWRHRCAGFSLESLALVFTFALFKGLER